MAKMNVGFRVTTGDFRQRWRTLVMMPLLVIPTFVASVTSAQLTSVAQFIQEGSSPPFGPREGEDRLGQAQIAGDFNGDGFADLVLGRSRGQGRAYVFHGSPGGLVFAEVLQQFQTLGFGSAFATCDLDEDGYEDLMVGAPRTEVDGENGAGAVFVYLGGPGGLNFTQSVTQDDLGLSVDGDESFGQALAAGDFDGDFACDLAVASPEEDEPGVGAPVDVGHVTIVWGLGNGLLSFANELEIRESLVPHGGPPEVPSSFDNFGEVLRTVPELGGVSLLVGVPSRGDGGLSNVGRVWLIHFDGQDLDQSAFVDFADLSTLGNPGGGEEFGQALAFGSFGPNGVPAVAIGIPGVTVSSFSDAGAALILALDQFGTAVPVGQVLTQAVVGVSSDVGTNEDFGRGLLAGDFNGDGWDDLAVGVPDNIDQAGSTFRGMTERFGAAHVFYGSPGGLQEGNFFEESDFGGSAETDDFGFSFAAGDFVGAGADSLSISAPRKNGLPARGFGVDDFNGAVYVVATTKAFVRAQQQVRTGVPLEVGGASVGTLSDPAATATGVIGFRGTYDGAGAESFVAVGDSIVFEDSDSGAGLLGKHVEVGFALAGSGLFAHVDASAVLAERVLVTPGGLLASEGEAAPGGGLVGQMDNLIAIADDRLYFRGADSVLNEERILRSAPGFVGPLAKVLGVGDPVDGLVLKQIERFDVSTDGTHLIYTGILGNIADSWFVVVDGERISSLGRGSGPGVQEFGSVAINSAGQYFYSAHLLDDSYRVFAGQDSGITSVIGDAAFLDGMDLRMFEPVALSLGDSGNGLHLWQVPFLNRGGVLGPQPAVLFANCSVVLAESEQILRTGQSVDTDGDAVADATVLWIYAPKSPEGLEMVTDTLTGEEAVAVRVALVSGTESFEAILRLPLPCGVFSDGFESGDTTAWSTGQ